METRELALCLVGQLRGICRAADFASLFDVVLNKFASVDAYLVFPQSSCATDVKLFVQGAVGRHDDIRALELCQSDDLDDSADVKTYHFFHSHDWWRQAWHNITRLRNIMISAKHIAACGAEIRKRTHETSYRFVARVRPDVLWHSFIPRKVLDAVVPSVVLLNFVAMPIQGVVEDTFAIGRWEEMDAYFSFYRDQLLDTERLDSIKMPWCVVHATRRERSFCNLVFAENLVEEHMRRHKGIQLQKRRSICFERVHPCMQERTHYCSFTPRNHRGFLQTNPRDYLQLDSDFFLTAPADYAAYDSVLASRLAHFLIQESVRLRHPPRLLDLGCGRCSYVEALSSWGFPAIGVDGNAVIHRSLPRQSIRWDLTQRFNIQRVFPPRSCEYVFYEFNSPLLVELARTYTAQHGGARLKLDVLLEVPRLMEAKFRPGDEPIGGVALQFLRTLCCADIRCAGFSSDDDNGYTLMWSRVVDEADVALVLNPLPTFVREVSEPWVHLHPDTKSLLEERASFDFDGQYASLDISFSVADWVLSLGVGAEVPRMGEKVFVENIARNAAEGVIISWGDIGPNRRSPEAVLSLFEPYGFALDNATSNDIIFFAGFSHAGDRPDLLVLRRSHAFGLKDATQIKLIRHWGGKACEAGVNFGQLGLGRMWAAESCVGIFATVGDEGKTLFSLCIGGYGKQWRECVFHSIDHPTIDAPVENLMLRTQAPSDQFRIDAMAASHLYDQSDHIVPQLGVWLGNPRLNLVFFKVARAVASPRRAVNLPVAWNWFWSESWYELIRRPPVTSGGSEVVKQSFVMWQIARVCLAWQQLACRMWADTSYSSFRNGISADIAAFDSWQPVTDALDAVDNLVSECAQKGEGSADCSNHEELWKTIELVKHQIAQRVSHLSPIVALNCVRDLVNMVLPRIWEIGSALDFSTAGLVSRGRGCQADVWDPTSNVAKYWDTDTIAGWYLYRLAALDPEM